MHSYKTAWIVDDDMTYHHFLGAFLKELGYVTKSFLTGDDCLECISEKPDFIILDHNLGEEKNGLDILRNIKFEAPEIPVIYLSGQKKISMVSDAYNFGSEVYIEKDSASLLRIKLRIEKLEKIRLLKEKKKANLLKARIAITSIILTSILVALYFIIW